MPKRPIALEDVLRFQLVGDAQIAPDGSRVVFSVKRIDAEKNKYFTRLWMAYASGNVAHAFTGDGHTDSEPRWSPDGARIAFISDREKPKSQIYLIDSSGGEGQALTDLDEGAFQGISWSPDGTRIAFLYRRTPEDRWEEVEKKRKEDGFSSPVRVHSKLFYRLDGFGYFDDSFWQIHVADVATGKVTQLTNEPRNFGRPAWSPDGLRLLFTANRNDDDDIRSNVLDLWTIPASGGELVQIPAPEGPKDQPAWSPDGRWIAYVGHTDPDDTWGCLNDRVLLIPVDGSTEVRDLTGASDKAVGYATLCDLHEVGAGAVVQWSPDSRSLYFPVSERGDTGLYRIGIDGSGLTRLTPVDHELGSFSISADGRTFGLQIGNATDTHEAHIWTLQGDSLDLRAHAPVNNALLAEIEMQMPEEFEISNVEGGSIQTWILRPTGFEASRRYPCVLYVHGGPAAQYGGKAAPFHELQWLAANGYVVIFSNPRGGKGYGEDFCSSIKGDWGNKDWIDIQAVADYAASLPYVDSTRMAIMGGSYGGYMTAWAVGHTDRFRCAITDRLVGNLHSMAGTSDFAWEHGKFYKGNAWDDPSDLWRVSPLHFAGNITTPLLIIHSDFDLRCPIGQAEELFAALRLQKKEVEFVRYPAESSHGLSRNGPPDLRLDRLKRNLAWLDKYLKD